VRSTGLVCVQARDPDLGLNGEVRYQILGRADEAARRFAIDPITGQVRGIANFARDAGKVYGFDVKATDKKGADDGKSSIANVFVSVFSIRYQGAPHMRPQNFMQYRNRWA
jgi:hypothetical protein